MSVAVSKMCQFSGFLLLVSTLFLALSVCSYSPDDPAWNYYVSHGGQVVRNLGGAVGASLADWGLQMFGSTIILLAGISAIEAWYLMRQRLHCTLAVAWRGLVLLAAVSTAAQIGLGRDPFFGSHMSAGGVGGQWLASVSLKYLDTLGTYLVVCAAVILALFIGVDPHGFYHKGWRRIMAAVAWGQRRGASLYLGFSTLADAGARLQTAWHRAWSWPWRRAEPPADVQAAASYGVADAPGAPLANEPEDGSEAFFNEASWDEEDADTMTAAQARIAAPVTETVPAPARRRSGRRRRRQDTGALPALDLLEMPEKPTQRQQPEELETQARFLEQKLRDFGVEGEVVEVLPGPVITMYEYAPASGVKVSKIVNLQDDLALVMRAMSVRVVAPIPGKAVVGIEIPNPHRETVRLRDIMDSDAFPASAPKLSLALGKDIMGAPMATDLALSRIC